MPTFSQTVSPQSLKAQVESSKQLTKISLAKIFNKTRIPTPIKTLGDSVIKRPIASFQIFWREMEGVLMYEKEGNTSISGVTLNEGTKEEIPSLYSSSTESNVARTSGGTF
jgi:hypothetical protein